MKLAKPLQHILMRTDIAERANDVRGLATNLGIDREVCLDLFGLLELQKT